MHDVAEAIDRHEIADRHCPGITYLGEIVPREVHQHQVLCHLDVLREAAGVTRIDDRGLEMWLPEEAEQQAELFAADTLAGAGTELCTSDAADH